MKAVSDNERYFVENFLAIAYFRIPKFRSHLLEIFNEFNNIEILEWRGTDYKINSIEEEQENNLNINKNVLLDMFDWEKDFYSYLET